MSDNPQAAADQASSAATPQAGSSQQATPVVDLSKLESLPESWQQEISSLRRENAKYRTTAQASADAEKSEAQQLRGQLDEITPKYTDLQTRYNTLRSKIALMGAGVDASDADLLASRLDSTVLDDVDKLAKALDKLRQQYPRPFKVGSADGGARGGTGSSGSAFMNNLIHTRSRR